MDELHALEILQTISAFDLAELQYTFFEISLWTKDQQQAHDKFNHTTPFSIHAFITRITSPSEPFDQQINRLTPQQYFLIGPENSAKLFLLHEIFDYHEAFSYISEILHILYSAVIEKRRQKSLSRIVDDPNNGHEKHKYIELHDKVTESIARENLLNQIKQIKEENAEKKVGVLIEKCSTYKEQLINTIKVTAKKHEDISAELRVNIEKYEKMDELLLILHSPKSASQKIKQFSCQIYKNRNMLES